MSASATASYPASSLSAESYQKMPLSGVSHFTAEPQESPLQTSMPSVQLSLTASEQQQPAMRTQYAYGQGSAAPPQLSTSVTAMGSGSEHNLSVPRYVEHDTRPSKSPRHAAHQSVHSTSSITNNDTSEYRYGPSYVPVNNNNPNELSPTSYNGPDSGSAGHHHSQPPRDYYPPSSTWTTTAGEPNASIPTYHHTERPYAYPDQYKTGHSMPPLKTEHSQAPAYGNTLSHYSWSPT